jgi:hypothetical protein
VVTALGNGAYLFLGAPAGVWQIGCHPRACSSRPISPAIGYAPTLWVGVGIIACSVLVMATSPIIGLRDLPKEWEAAA